MARQGDVNHITGDILYVALGLSGPRTLLTIPDCRSMVRLSGLRRTVFKALWLSLPVKHCARVVAISEFTRREICALLRLSPSRVSVVPVPVLQEFQYLPQDFRTAYPRILQIGTGQNKNLHRVAAALEGVSCELAVVGKLDANDIAILNRYNVRFSNVCDVPDQEMPGLYAKADLVVFASVYEGFGLPIIEAQATGRAVVTSRIGPMPEVAGGGACMVDPFDIRSIRNGILQVIQERQVREELVVKGLQNVRRFRPEVIAEQYAELYRELARQ